MSQQQDFKTHEKLSIPEAAAMMGVTPQFLRIALRQGRFNFGTAVKMKRWAYYINPQRFKQYLSS